MAGSDEFKQALSRADRNRAARERIANDPDKSAAKLSRIPDEYKTGKYSDKELVMAFRGDKFDKTDYARLTGESLEENNSSSSSAVESPATDPQNSSIPGLGDAADAGSIDVNAGGGFDINIGGNYGPGGPGIGPGGDGSFSVGGDLNQNVGKQGDMTTTIGDGNTFGAGTTIGNDNSMTVGSNTAGNSNFGAALNRERQARAQAGAFGRGLQFS